MSPIDRPALWLDLSENGLTLEAALAIAAWLSGEAGGYHSGSCTLGDASSLGEASSSTSNDSGGNDGGGSSGGESGSSGDGGGAWDDARAAMQRRPARLRYRFYCALNMNRFGDAGARSAGQRGGGLRKGVLLIGGAHGAAVERCEPCGLRLFDA